MRLWVMVGFSDSCVVVGAWAGAIIDVGIFAAVVCRFCSIVIFLFKKSSSLFVVWEIKIPSQFTTVRLMRGITLRYIPCGG